MLNTSNSADGMDMQENGQGDHDMEDDDDDDDDDPTEGLTYETLTALGELVGTVSTGLTQAQIEALHHTAYSMVCSKEACKNEDEEQCTVCRVEYEENEQVTVLPCKHYYHSECIEQWLKNKKVCPQCNVEISFGGNSSNSREQPPPQQQFGGENQNHRVPFGVRQN